MAVVNEIKCARCDRKYSGVRSRCPYCGARRIGRGKYSEDSDNARGKMLISVVIMAVFTVGAAILLFTTPGDVSAQDPVDPPGLGSPEDEINSLPPIVEPTPTPTPEPTPVIVEEITSIRVTFGNDQLLGGADNQFSLTTRYPDLGIRATVEPITLDWSILNVEFISSNPEVFTVEPVIVGAGEGVYGAKLERTGNGGSATLRVVATYHSQEVEWTVRVFG